MAPISSPTTAPIITPAQGLPVIPQVLPEHFPRYPITPPRIPPAISPIKYFIIIPAALSTQGRGKNNRNYHAGASYASLQRILLFRVSHSSKVSIQRLPSSPISTWSSEILTTGQHEPLEHRFTIFIAKPPFAIFIIIPLGLPFVCDKSRLQREGIIVQ